MIMVTCDEIPGKRIIKTLGLVRGNTIRARHIGRDIMAKLRGIVGGEIVDYTKMIAEASKPWIAWARRQRSLARMPLSPFDSALPR
jgi:uncharacterized protein YbjQ (UPF0145 family)